MTREELIRKAEELQIEEPKIRFGFRGLTNESLEDMLEQIEGKHIVAKGSIIGKINADGNDLEEVIYTDTKFYYRGKAYNTAEPFFLSLLNTKSKYVDVVRGTLSTGQMEHIIVRSKQESFNKYFEVYTLVTKGLKGKNKEEIEKFLEKILDKAREINDFIRTHTNTCISININKKV